MMIFKPYNKHKQSDIDWLGAVPQHWNLFRTDSVTKYIRNQINPESIQAETVFHYSIPIVQETGTGQYEPTDDLGSAKQLITMKSVLVSKLNPRKATICIAEPKDEVTICSSEFIAMEAKNCDLKYLYYLMNSEMNRQRLDSRVQSVTRSHQRVYPSDIYRFWTALPLTIEQQTIVSFLDQETARIDALIQKKERMIELLKEKRIALITKAVTKGLDPNVPMKDSGIEWLGEVPEHWELMRIRNIVKPGNQGVKIGPFGSQIRSDILVETGYKIYGQENIINDNFSLGDRFIDEQTYRELFVCEIVPGDLLITMMGSSGQCKVLPEGYPIGIMDSHLIRLRTNSKVDTKYLELVIGSSVYAQHQIRLASKGSIMSGMNSSIIKDLLILVPSPIEQKQILAKLEKWMAKIDSLVEEITKTISLLREYRSSLIHHAVTGKIDLRGYDAQA